mmetsp:Transcript_12352/g.49775  ORF Transcript_12352/g.49775 Transcript_12352/m.49775 type:complete len:234 (-) Transcript_12352:171-872(-)
MSRCRRTPSRRKGPLVDLAAVASRCAPCASCSCASAPAAAASRRSRRRRGCAVGVSGASSGPSAVACRVGRVMIRRQFARARRSPCRRSSRGCSKLLRGRRILTGLSTHGVPGRRSAETLDRPGWPTWLARADPGSVAPRRLGRRVWRGAAAMTRCAVGPHTFGRGVSAAEAAMTAQWDRAHDSSRKPVLSGDVKPRRRGAAAPRARCVAWRSGDDCVRGPDRALDSSLLSDT